MLRKDDDDWVKKCMEHEVEGSRPRGRPKKTWKEVVREDCRARKLNKEDAMDRCKWRKMIREARWFGWVWVGESPFWYRPTRVVPDQRPLNGRCIIQNGLPFWCCFNQVVLEMPLNGSSVCQSGFLELFHIRLGVAAWNWWYDRVQNTKYCNGPVWLHCPSSYPAFSFWWWHTCKQG